MELDSNCLFINISNQYSWNPIESLWRNLLIRSGFNQNIRNWLKEMENRSKVIEFDQKVNINWFFDEIQLFQSFNQHYIHLFWSINWLLDRKEIKFNRFWSNLIEKRWTIDWIRNKQYNINVRISIIIYSFGGLGIRIVNNLFPEP